MLLRVVPSVALVEAADGMLDAINPAKQIYPHNYLNSHFIFKLSRAFAGAR